jgi:hypothetical protein
MVTFVLKALNIWSLNLELCSFVGKESFKITLKNYSEQNKIDGKSDFSSILFLYYISCNT